MNNQSLCSERVFERGIIVKMVQVQIMSEPSCFVENKRAWGIKSKWLEEHVEISQPPMKGFFEILSKSFLFAKQFESDLS